MPGRVNVLSSLTSLFPDVTCIRRQTSQPAPKGIHIFSGVSERVYWSETYLQTVDHTGEIHVTFLAVRSRAAKVHQQSISNPYPRLRLCVSHIMAQLAAVLRKEPNLHISSITHWTDAITVLDWLQSPSRHYKLFTGAWLIRRPARRSWLTFD